MNTHEKNTNNGAIEQLLAQTFGPEPLSDSEVERLFDTEAAFENSSQLQRIADKAESLIHESSAGRLQSHNQTPTGKVVTMNRVTEYRSEQVTRSRNPRGAAAALTVSAMALVAVLFWTSEESVRRETRVAAKHQQQLQQVAAIQQTWMTAAVVPEVPVKFAVVGDVITTSDRERRRVTLPDGSVLYVNESASVKVATDRRIEVERGEVFVEVVPVFNQANQKELFEVVTPTRTVTALGTKFGVDASDGSAEVLVTQGKVKVSGSDDVVEAGQHFTEIGIDVPHVAPVQTAVITSAERASEHLSWTRDLMQAASGALVPASNHAGGSIISIDPNGQEMKLSLRKYHVDVHIQDGFARTTIDQTYFNHTHRRLEGTFHFPLPSDASLSRLAMYVNGKLMEGGMAERQHARNTFEQIVHKMKDPALLEWVDGSTFKMRVFPLEARREKRIVLSYTQRLNSAYGKTYYRFPAGHSMDVVREWSTSLRVHGGKGQAWHSPSHDLKSETDSGDLLLSAKEANSTMSSDLVLEFTERVDRMAQGRDTAMWSRMELDGQQYLMLRNRPELPGKMKRQSRHWVFLFEASADRNPLLARTQVEVIRTLLDNAEHSDTFNIVTANTKATTFSKQPLECSGNNIAKAMRHLQQTHLVGALDVQKAMISSSAALEQAGVETGAAVGKERVLVHLGSGIPVLGQQDQGELLRVLPRDAAYVGVGVGKSWSQSFMKQAASQTGGYFTQINPDEEVSWRAFELSSLLNTPRLLQVAVAAKQKAGNGQKKGADWLNFADTIVQGEEICAVTRLAAKQKLPKSVAVTGLLDGKPWRRTVRVAGVSEKADYLPRTWAKLQIDRLIADSPAEHKNEIIRLSKSMYVMSPFTSLLVLENEEMYTQFNIDRGRKDHWALYACPDEIKVVYEPVQYGNVVDGEQLADQNQWQNTIRFLGGYQPSEALNQPQHNRWELNSRLAPTPHNYLYFKHSGPSDFLTRSSGILPLNLSGVSRPQSQLWEGRMVSRLGFSAFQRWQAPDLPVPILDPIDGEFAPVFAVDPPTDESLGFVQSSEEEFLKRLSQVRANSRRGISSFGLGENFGVDWIQEQPTPEGFALNARGRGGRLRDMDRMLGAVTKRVNPSGTSEVTVRQIGDDRLDVIVPGAEGRNNSGLEFSGFGQTRNGRLSEWPSDVLSPRFALPLLAGADVSFGQTRYGLSQLQAIESSAGFFGGNNDVRLEVDQSGIPAPIWLSIVPPQPGVNFQESQISSRLVPGIQNTGFLFGNRGSVSALSDFDTSMIPLGWAAPELNWDDGISQFDFSGNGMGGPRFESADRVSRIALPRWQDSGPVAQMLEVPGLESLRRNKSSIHTPTETIVRSLGTRDQQLLRKRYKRDSQLYRRTPSLDLRPQAANSFTDLISHAPALNTSYADVLAIAAEQAASQSENEPSGTFGDVNSGARKLIETARAGSWERITYPANESGESLTVLCDAAGRHTYSRTVSEGLSELVLCDGQTLTHTYADIGLGSKRAFSRFHRRTIESLAPWLLPSVKELSRNADVVLIDDYTVAIVPQRKAENDEQDGAETVDENWETHLVFAADGRLSERRIVRSESKKVVWRTVYEADGTVRVINGDDKELAVVKLKREPVAAPDLNPDLSQLVVLPMPVRSSEYLSQRAAEDGDKETDSDQQDSQLAMILAFMAEGKGTSVALLVHEWFFEKGDKRDGFYVLLSRFPHNLTWVADVDGSDGRKRDINLLPSPEGGPLRQFVRQYISSVRNKRPSVEFDVEGREDGFVQRLAKSNNLHYRWIAGKATSDRTKAQVKKELTEALQFVSTCKTDAYGWMLLSVIQPMIEAADLNEMLAAAAAKFEDSPQMAWVARQERVRSLFKANKHQKARKLYGQLLKATIQQGSVPLIDAKLRTQFVSNDGAKAWAKLVSECGEFLTGAKLLRTAFAFSVQLRQLGDVEQAGTILDNIVAGVSVDNRPDVMLLAVEQLRQLGDGKADQMLESLLEHESIQNDARLWRYAAGVAEDLGHKQAALLRLEHAIHLEFVNRPKVIDIQKLRSTYTSLMNRFEAVIDASATLETKVPHDLYARIVRAADQWRTLDEDATTCCHTTARLLSKLRKKELAWSYLTTPLAGRSGESTPWRSLAENLTAQQQIDLADMAWSKAFEFEQTNPEILLAHAKMLNANGRTSAGHQLLRRITDTSWQPRFAKIQQQARELLR